MSGTEHKPGERPGKHVFQDHLMHENMDRRTQRTRRALHQALIELILDRDYDTITVADIADAADVGRSTFYAHFVDKDDLLRNGAEHLRMMLFHEHGIEGAAEMSEERRTLGFSRFMTAHLKEQLPLYRAMMRGGAGPILVGRIREFLGELVRSELGAGSKSPGAAELRVQFIVGAYMAVLTWWLDRGAKEPPEEIDSAFRSLAEGALKA